MRGVFGCLILFLFLGASAQPAPESPILKQGWDELVKDNDSKAFEIFWNGYERALAAKNVSAQAEAMLYLGICSFGSNLEKGLQYATTSLELYKKLESADVQLAKLGRSKCLQLISTIYSRQGKYDLSEQMSREVVETLRDSGDDSGTLGLAYSMLGLLYEKEKNQDSAIAYQRMALREFEIHKTLAYLPGAYLKVGKLENRLDYIQRSLALADSTQNKQAQVSSLVAVGKWHFADGKLDQSERFYLKADSIARVLTDKTFEIHVIQALIELRESEKNYELANRLQKRLHHVKDSFYSLQREQMLKNLEVQFEVSEKNRKLDLLAKESEVAQLTNIILGSSVVILLIVAATGFIFFKSIRKRDRQLLETKENLVKALEEQRLLKEAQFKHDLQHNENQLNAVTVQMLQKNELIGEIKAAVENQQSLSGAQLLKIVNRHRTHENNWNEFDLYFESLNQNFYQRLKQRYPDISANDLKICALIKLNLSIKEMSSILNISPDSVKTARYRLRKKLHLHTEENLTDFILSV